MTSMLKSGKEYKPSTIIFYDLETTGFNPFYDKIIEIGAIKIVNNKTTKFNRLVSINMNLPKKICEITKINDSDLKNQPNIDTVMKDFINFISEEKNETIFLIAHNNDSFDKLFLIKNIKDLGINISFNIKYIDTLRFSQKILPGRFSYSLNSLCKYYEINQDNSHRAFDDAYNLSLIYKKLCAIYSMKSHYSYKYLLSKPDTIFDYIQI